MLLTDINELKSLLEIDPADTQEDKNLNFMIEQASNWLEEWMDRPLFYKVRTWVYCGTGTQKLVLKHRPVYPTLPPDIASSLPFSTLSVVLDEYAYFGAAQGAFTSSPTAQPLVYGSDYTIAIDQDDGGSREAILYRIQDTWPKLPIRQWNMLTPSLTKDLGSVRVTSTAGYTVDNLPSIIRWACDTIVEKMRYVHPIGMEIHSDSYAGKGLGFSPAQKDYLMSLVTPRLLPYRNWNFGGMA